MNKIEHHVQILDFTVYKGQWEKPYKL